LRFVWWKWGLIGRSGVRVELYALDGEDLRVSTTCTTSKEQLKSVALKDLDNR
jgi:hypothetical protein